MQPRVNICQSVSSMARRSKRTTWPRERLLRERAIAIACAIEPSSASAYSSATNSYFDFCSLHGFPVEPTSETLSFFAVYMAHHIRPKSSQVFAVNWNLFSPMSVPKGITGLLQRLLRDAGSYSHLRLQGNGLSPGQNSCRLHSTTHHLFPSTTPYSSPS